jgi:sigma-B regulation protein RsbU (phosphoserine phosphatase)
VLGLLPGQEYQSSTLELPAGESLVLFTDGVTEAADPASVLFGEERLRACLAGGTGQAAADTVDQLLRAVRGFAAGAPQSDDITFVAVRRR